MDGPGTGEAIRFRGMVLRHDYEKAGSACMDWLETRADVDAKRVGVVAISLGGYYSPRMASLEPRFAALLDIPAELAGEIADFVPDFTFRLVQLAGLAHKNADRIKRIAWAAGLPAVVVVVG
jgi:hypothetical protein